LSKKGKKKIRVPKIILDGDSKLLIDSIKGWLLLLLSVLLPLSRISVFDKLLSRN
jgi:hypothetical protein